MSVDSARAALSDLDAAINACRTAAASAICLEERLCVMKAQHALLVLRKGRMDALWAEIDREEEAEIGAETAPDAATREVQP